MSRIVKIGIIGCGGIANGKHMPSLAKLQNVRMIAFCDIKPELAEAAKAKYGTPDAKVYEDYRELLANEEIEVVHVLTPNREHAEISIAALEAGKHVMCEKPIAKTAADARRMVEAAKKDGQEAHYRLSEQTQCRKHICKGSYRGWRARQHLLRKLLCASPQRNSQLGRIP